MTEGEQVAHELSSSGPRTMVHTDLARKRAPRRAAAVVAALFVTAGLVAGSSDAGGSAFESALSLVAEESGSSPAFGGSTEVDAEPDLDDLWYQELRDGPAVRHLGVARLLDEAGVLELLGSYIVNIPAGAFFLHNFEIQAAMSASTWAHRDAENEHDGTHGFEQQILIAIDGAALNRRPAPSGPDALHEAFFEVFEQCGRDSPWPEVQMADRVGNTAGDVLSRDPELEISDYEYRELLHVCGRYAATYPTLDPAERDRLLAPQRAHFARVILDRLDNELPRVEVPDRYQAEIDDLRANGW